MPSRDGSRVVRVVRVVEYVQEQHRLAAARVQFDPVFTADYRYEHTLRVAHYGRLIADEEGLDRELCVAACLLHDVAYFACGDREGWWDDHGRMGAEISRSVLLGAGFSTEETNAMCHAIAVHVDGKADDGLPDGPVDNVVSDADNVDRFSALRIVLWCMTEREDLEKMAGMLRERLARLYKYRDTSPRKTKAGQRLFAERVALQIPFFEALVRDADITQPPIRGN
ncbi:MAG: HD domain-containing protein [Candidatus Bipolaricaulota bacterium]|nr:HD domain-containing protein [Candidatus Bipolaricaulota bacterium]